MAVPESSGLHKAESPAAGVAGQIEAIIKRNISSGRFQRVCDFRRRMLTIEEYTGLVSTYYAENYPLVSGLEQGEPEAWTRLSKRLFRAAYALLLQRNWGHEQAYVRAQEATQEACLSIYCRVYPYDCPFDAWIFTILRHHVFRSHHRPRNPLDLPEAINPLDKLPQKTTVSKEVDDFEPSERLLQALGRLRSTAQQQVIDYLFFQGLSPEEVAQKLGKTTQAIYNLKGRAVARLAELLTNDELG